MFRYLLTLPSGGDASSEEDAAAKAAMAEVHADALPDGESAPSEPAAAPAVKGDTPPAGAQKPRNFPDAVWSDRAGAWIVQRDGKWRPVTDVKG